MRRREMARQKKEEVRLESSGTKDTKNLSVGTSRGRDTP